MSGRLSDRLQGLFSHATRVRGTALVDRVQLDDDWNRDTFPCFARLRGAMLYDLCVDPDDDIAAGWCTCPAFGDLGPCKHMWAAVLRIDAEGGRAVVAATVEREPEPLEVGGHSKFKLVEGGSDFIEGQPEWVDETSGSSLAETLRRLRREFARAAGNESDAVEGALRESRRRIDRLRRSDLDFEPSLDILTAARLRLQFVLVKLSEPSADRVCTVCPIARSRLSTGKWGRPLSIQQARDDVDWEMVPTVEQRDWAALLPYVEGEYRGFSMAYLPTDFAEELLPGIAERGCLFWHEQRNPDMAAGKLIHPVAPLDLESGGVLSVTPEVRAVDEGSIVLRFEDLDTIGAVIGPNLLVREGRLRRWRSAAPTHVVANLVVDGPITLPADERERLESVLTDRTVPESPIAPSAEFHLDQSLFDIARERLLRGELYFRYHDDDGVSRLVEAGDIDAFIRLGKQSFKRDVEAERTWLERLLACGGVLHSEFNEPRVSLPRKDVADTVRQLLSVGFEVFAAKERVRSVQTTSVRVQSGIDWFDLHAQVQTSDGERVEVPDLLSGVRKKADFVRLAHGEVALLDAAAADLGALGRLGQLEDGALRFAKSQGFLLDALLQARQFEVNADDAFRKIRRHAERGLSVQSKKEPVGFGATLRPYQRDGLGWFEFLRSLGVGGCLADDMGLGKTVQVLAMLEHQRRCRPKPGPSMVVVPRSLLFHWQREAERFAPKLRTVAFHGSKRHRGDVGRALARNFAQHDLVLTTYATLRIDADRLHDIEWNYLVLDESQAVKNERSQASKAVRACRAEHRLALSGTPIENHLGELWALFEFLNPGMLGASSTFRKVMKETGGKNAGEGQLAEVSPWTGALRAAVRPFMLRRTKAQVLTDLPDKTIQVLDCELSGGQKKSYDQLAAHYRGVLLGDIDEGKLPDSMRFQVLEALLRLRQTACHPGLIDDGRSDEACAKFDVLWPMLTDLRQEGHKALVFSQFPSFLKLLRARLEKDAIDYAYLDGKTRQREAEVERFQSDPDCGLFLISIKAGGHGLNLTAASYVFLLDPWWNPAIEAQAIDRAHRIGQSKKVHAYRLITRDTVEERVAELQEHKRQIAEAVLGDDTSVLQDLTAADVARLLG